MARTTRNLQYAYVLFFCYALGIGTPTDYKEALHACLEAAKGGIAAARKISHALYHGVLQLGPVKLPNSVTLRELQGYVMFENFHDMGLQREEVELSSYLQRIELPETLPTHEKVSWCLCTMSNAEGIDARKEFLRNRPGVPHVFCRQGKSIPECKSLLRPLAGFFEGFHIEKRCKMPVGSAPYAAHVGAWLTITQDSHGFHCLHYISACRHPDKSELVLMTEYILRCGERLEESGKDSPLHFDVDVRDPEGRTPLWWAVLSDNIPVALRLLEHGANPSVEDNYRCAPIDIAAHYHRSVLVGALLTSPKMIETHAHDFLGWCRRLRDQASEVEPIQRMIRHGARYLTVMKDTLEELEKIERMVWRKNIGGSDEVLKRAAAAGNLDVVEYVCSSSQNYSDFTPESVQQAAIFALQYGKQSVIKAILPYLKGTPSVDWTYLLAIALASQSTTETIRLLLDYGTPVYSDSNNCLAIAASRIENAHAKILPLLLDSCPKALDLPILKNHHKGYAPIQLATQHKMWDNVKYLLDRGAKFCGAPIDNHLIASSPLQIAASQFEENDDIYGLEMLLRHPRCSSHDVDLQDTEGRTALHLAAFFGKETAAQLLLRYKASVNLQDRNGQTPLHYVYNRYARICCDPVDPSLQLRWNNEKGVFERMKRLLLQYGANPDIRDYADGLDIITHDIVKEKLTAEERFNKKVVEIMMTGTYMYVQTQNAEGLFIPFSVNAMKKL